MIFILVMSSCGARKAGSVKVALNSQHKDAIYVAEQVLEPYMESGNGIHIDFAKPYESQKLLIKAYAELYDTFDLGTQIKVDAAYSERMTIHSPVWPATWE
ncbi:MAG: hypothetical protein PF961_13135 [Planctomycetota bacterium]|nr:hypothetical protein [Planctomycetota bacterium]